MERPFEVLDTYDLLNALADYTARYTRMLAGGGKQQDINNCGETIQSLITEIELRKKSEASNDPASKKDR